MKKVLAILLTAVMLLSLTVTAVNAEEPTDNNDEGYYLESNYFIIGTMTNWQLDPNYRLCVGYKDYGVRDYENYYFHLYMTPDDSFKIVYCPDGKTLDNATYFPEGRGNAFNQENPIILKKAFYSFQFRPACDGDKIYGDNYYDSYGTGVNVWYYHCIYCHGYDPWANNEICYPNPDPEHNDPEPGYYFVGTMTDWQINKRYKFENLWGHIALRMCDRFKIAYSEDGVNITRWYPEGEDDIYSISIKNGGDSAWYNFYFYSGGGAKSENSISPDNALDDHLILICAPPPSELEPYPTPAEGELFKAKLKADYSLSDKDFTEYEELCYHKDKDGLPDWTLLKAKTTKTSEQTYRAIIANRVCEHEQSASLFGSGYGIYDASEKRFIPLTDDIVGQYKDLGRIFDNLGSGRLIGDVDSDDELTAIDCTLIQRCATRICDWPEDDIVDSEGLDLVYFSDFDRDGERDIVDATRLQRYVIYID